MALTAKDISFDSNPLSITERRFQVLSEQKYALSFLPAGIHFEVDRLRRDRHELHGELSVRVNGNFPTAKTHEGIVNVGDFNFSSVQARTARAKIFADRSGNTTPDWFGLLEEFCVRVIKAERTGPTPVDLKSVPIDEERERAETWDVLGFPVLQVHPMIIFGDGGGGKSYFAMHIAGRLAQMGVRVLYCDWEFEVGAHRNRFRRLFRPEPEGLLYLKCEKPMVREVEQITKAVREHQIGYVICDSVGYACEGRPEEAERANEYFRAVRALNVGSLHLAHTTKSQDENHKPDGPIGSVFWRNGARSVWFIQGAKENTDGQFSFGLYHRKNNLGRLLAPRAYTLTFIDKITTITETSVQDIDELAAALPALERIKKYLKGAGAQAVKSIADELNLPQPIVRATLSKHKSQFMHVGKVWGVKDGSTESF